MRVMSLMFMFAAFLLLHIGTCMCSDGTSVQDCETESDATALLSVASQLREATAAIRNDKHVVNPSSSESPAAQKLSLLMASYETNPIQTLEMLQDMLRITAAGARDKKGASLLASDMETRACDGESGPCWPATRHPHLEHQPKYPFEPLLDVDFIDNAGNWLDQWIMENHTTTANTSHKKPATALQKPAAPNKSAAPQKSTAPHKSALFQKPCVTHDVSGSSSKAGTKCLFGVADEDEGSHCIYDDGKYGSFGWCWTDKDKKEWGSCSDSCPVHGPTKLLTQKIERLENKVKLMLQRLGKTQTSK